MAQVTIYLPDELAERLRRQAKKEGQSLSAFVAALATGNRSRTRWPAGFAKLFGSWEGEFSEIEDLTIEEPEPLV